MVHIKASIIAGARPNFMKIAPLVEPLRAVGIRTRIIHTGQHYDQQMSQTFFEELRIPRPDVNLEVGSGSHVHQLAEVMKRLEIEFTDARPDVVIVVGDVNSTLAAALTANKLGIYVAHVEAGLRSGDRTMPEEINRILTDSISDFLFTSEPCAERNLLKEGVCPNKIHFVGNVMVDTLLAHLDKARSGHPYRKFGLDKGDYALLTLHRPSNVDDPDRLRPILKAVHEVSKRLPVVFPVHPRTRSRIEQFGLANEAEFNGYLDVPPQGYLTMLGLMDSARFVLTDSGGIQEETTALRVPCRTLRENTERPITLEVGTNRLVGWRTADIVEAVDSLVKRPDREASVPEYWDGKASVRIAERLRSKFSATR